MNVYAWLQYLSITNLFMHHLCIDKERVHNKDYMQWTKPTEPVCGERERGRERERERERDRE